jgi:hypothetical protein
MKKLLRVSDRYPSISRPTRVRWTKELRQLIGEPDLIAGGVCFFTEEKFDAFDKLRTQRDGAKMNARTEAAKARYAKGVAHGPVEPEPPAKRKRGRPPKVRPEEHQAQ